MNKYCLSTILVAWGTICLGQIAAGIKDAQTTIDSVMQIQEFEKIAERLVLSDTADIGLIFARVAGLSDNKRGTEAVALLDRLLTLRPDDYRLQTLKSMAVHSLSVQEKIEYYQESIKRNPEDPVNHFNLGECFVTIEEFKKALIHYNKAIELLPGDEHYRYARAKCNFDLGRKKDCCKELESLKLLEARQFRDRNCK